MLYCHAVFGSKHYIHGYFQYTWWNDKCYVTVTSWSGFITRLVLHLLPILIMECVRLLLHTIIANSECLEGDGTRTEGVSWLTVRRVFRKRIIALADIGFIDNYGYKLLITAISCAAELTVLTCSRASNQPIDTRFKVTLKNNLCLSNYYTYCNVSTFHFSFFAARSSTYVLYKNDYQSSSSLRAAIITTF